VWRAELTRFLELFAMCGLAVALPLLDAFGNQPDEFVSRGVGTLPGIVFALLVLFVPPVILLGLTAPLRLFGPRLFAAAHRWILAGLSGTAVVEMLIGLPVGLRWTAGVACTVGLARLLDRSDHARRAIRLLAPLPVALLCVFLLFSQTSQIVLRDTPTVPALDDVRVGADTPVVMILFEELPTVSLLDGHGSINAAAFPNFAELARGSTWYRNFTTVSPSTTKATPAMLTGRRPHAGPGTASNYAFSLFTLLGAHYRMNVQESVTSLCPPELCTRINEVGADAGVAGLGGTAAQRWIESLGPNGFDALGAPGTIPVQSEDGPLDFGGGTDRVDFHDPIRFQEFERSLTDAPRTLNLLHVVVPHRPWELLPSGRTYTAGSELMPGSSLDRWDTESAATTARQRHLVQLQYADLWLGRLIAKMKETGLWDKALIMVAAGTGISFQTNQPARELTDRNAYELLWCPLFVRGARFKAGVRDERAATGLDLVPTIVDSLSISPALGFDGTSLLEKKSANVQKRAVLRGLLNGLPEVKDGYALVDSRTNYEKVKSAAAPGLGDDDLHLFRTGPTPALVGQNVKDIKQVAMGEPPAQRATFDAPGANPVFDVASPQAPVYVSGRIPEYTGRLLLTLDEMVVGSTTISRLDRSRFRFLLPESRLKAGQNRLGLYAVDVQGIRVTLRPFNLQ